MAKNIMMLPHQLHLPFLHKVVEDGVALPAVQFLSGWVEDRFMLDQELLAFMEVIAEGNHMRHCV